MRIAFSEFSASNRRMLEHIRRIADAQKVTAFLVGGPVRDALLKQPCGDLDVSVEGDGRKVARSLAQETEGVCTEHPRFGTARVTWEDGRHVDMATTRTETYDHPGALPQVARASIQADLSRRDFSINAMAVYLNTPKRGEVLDVLGGQDDLRRKQLRILHAGSFQDDPTRMFRILRFAQRLGFSVESGTQKAWQRALDENALRTLSPSRWFHEVECALRELDAFAALHALHLSGILEQVLPGICLSDKAQGKYAELYLQHPDLHLQDVDTTLVRMLACFSATPRSILEPVLHAAGVNHLWQQSWHWHWSHAQDLVARLQGPRLAPYTLVTELRSASVENVLVLAAQCGAKAKTWLLPYLNQYRTCSPKLKGGDLKMLGIKPGPEFARVLEALLKARLEGAVTTQADEIRWVRTELVESVGAGTGVDAPRKKR